MTSYFDVFSAYVSLQKNLAERKKEGYYKNQEMYAINLLLFIFFIWLILFMLAIYSLVQCARIRNWPWYMIALIILLICVPGPVGGAVSLAIIIYWFIGCK